MNDKLRVLLICHFSNPGIRNKLDLFSDNVYYDFGAWITNRLHAYVGCDSLELHVVAPHAGMRRMNQSFVLNGINYYFYSAGSRLGKVFQSALTYATFKIGNGSISNILQVARHFYLALSYFPQKRYVKWLVVKVKPDIIHLNGAENPYYSSTISGLKNMGIPIVISIQGIVSDPQAIALTKYIDRSKIAIERKIHKGFNYYIVGSPDHYCLVKDDNPHAIFFFSPDIRLISIDPRSEVAHKEFDFVFFARLDPIKGIEHTLTALSRIKVVIPNVSLLVLGPVSNTYLMRLKVLCKELDIEENVVFGGYIASHEDLLRYVLRARIYVLPTLIEGLATTAVEAMLLGLPVITYASGGMPFLNNDGENVLMCKTGDIDGLTENMKRLLDDQCFTQELASRGQDFARRAFGIDENVKLNIRQYRAIMEHYHLHTPVPVDLLFKGKEK